MGDTGLTGKVNQMSKEAPQPEVAASAEVLEKLRELAELIGKQQFGEDGRPPRETTFAAIEELGHQAGQLLSAEVDRQLAASHREHFADAQPCPQCGRMCDTVASKRPLTTRDGPLELPEAACHCPDCRRDFFPSTCATEAG